MGADAASWRIGTSDFICFGYGAKWVRLVFSFLWTQGAPGTAGRQCPADCMVARGRRAAWANLGKTTEEKRDKKLEFGNWFIACSRRDEPFTLGIDKRFGTSEDLFLAMGASGQPPGGLPTIPQLYLSSVHERAGNRGVGRLAAGWAASRSFLNGVPQMRN